MNDKRRRAIRGIIRTIRSGNPDWDYIDSELNSILDDETDAMESIPENLQDSDRYTTCEESVGYLEDAISNIDPDDEDCSKNVIAALEQIDGV